MTGFVLCIKKQNIFEFPKTKDMQLTRKDLNLCWGPSLDIGLFVLRERM